MKRFQGAISLDYILVSQSVPSYFELEDALASRIAALYSNPIVVDIGLGTGITTKAIIAKNPSCKIRAIDNEPSMVAQAESELKSEIANGDVEVHMNDALEVMKALPTASVDVVASAYTLHNCLKVYREHLEVEIFRVLKAGGMFINDDKYAADDRDKYVKELTKQIIRYDVLSERGRSDLRRLWVEHEIEDQVPERIMWTQQSLDQLRRIGFLSPLLIQRIGQYAIMAAHK